MSIPVAGARKPKEVVVKFPEVPHLVPYKKGDKFIIPHDVYESDMVIQDEALSLMESVQKTEFGGISWSIKTENGPSGRVVIVFMLME